MEHCPSWAKGLHLWRYPEKKVPIPVEEPGAIAKVIREKGDEKSEFYHKLVAQLGARDPRFCGSMEFRGADPSLILVMHFDERVFPKRAGTRGWGNVMTKWPGKTRRLLVGILGFFLILGAAGGGFILPNSILMFQEGGFDLWYQVWVEWNPEGFDSWVSIWWSILGGCVGSLTGRLVWYFVVLASGLLTQDEMDQFLKVRDRRGLLGAIHDQSSETDKERTEKK